MRLKNNLSDLVGMKALETDQEGLLRGGFSMLSVNANAMSARGNGNCNCSCNNSPCESNGNCDCECNNGSCTSNDNCDCDCDTPTTPTIASGNGEPGAPHLGLGHFAF